MNNIIANIQGNLGNVLFQLAHAITFASKSNRKLYIKYNDEKSKTVFKNSKLLKSLQIPEWEEDFKKSDVFIHDNKNHEFIEFNKDYPNKNVFITGYFESEKYFDPCLIKILFDFNSILSNELIEKYRIKKDSVALSVRRGDILYLKKLYYVPSKEYYNTLIHDYVSNRERVIVSSDDIEWCKENIEYSDCEYLQESPELNMALLSLCKTHINSSSTFSWWSSWINEDDDSLNIFPNVRFKDPIKSENDSKIYIPDRWIKYESSFYE